MSRKLFIYEVSGFIFVGVFGTLNHFLFDFFNSSAFVGLFCPVNESVWEHLKLLYFPYLLWCAVEYLALKKPKNFFFSKLIGALCGMAFIVIFFYTYAGITGNESTFANILSFFAGAAISFIVSYELMRNKKDSTRPNENFSISMLIFISSLFFIFTFSPPLIPLFEDPQTFTYGI